jgi:hypothetical protein
MEQETEAERKTRLFQLAKEIQEAEEESKRKDPNYISNDDKEEIEGNKRIEEQKKWKAEKERKKRENDELIEINNKYKLEQNKRIEEQKKQEEEKQKEENDMMIRYQKSLYNDIRNDKKLRLFTNIDKMKEYISFTYKKNIETYRPDPVHFEDFVNKLTNEILDEQKKENEQELPRLISNLKHAIRNGDYGNTAIRLNYLRGEFRENILKYSKLTNDEALKLIRDTIDEVDKEVEQEKANNLYVTYPDDTKLENVEIIKTTTPAKTTPKKTNNTPQIQQTNINQIQQKIDRTQNTDPLVSLPPPTQEKSIDYDKIKNDFQKLSENDFNDKYVEIIYDTNIDPKINNIIKDESSRRNKIKKSNFKKTEPDESTENRKRTAEEIDNDEKLAQNFTETINETFTTAAIQKEPLIEQNTAVSTEKDENTKKGPEQIEHYDIIQHFLNNGGLTNNQINSLISNINEYNALQKSLNRKIVFDINMIIDKKLPVAESRKLIFGLRKEINDAEKDEKRLVKELVNDAKIADKAENKKTTKTTKTTK